MTETIRLPETIEHVAVRRWQSFTGKRAVHAVTGEPFGD